MFLGCKANSVRRKEKDMRKVPTATETAIKHAIGEERYKLLLIAKESKDLDSFIATLEKLIQHN